MFTIRNYSKIIFTAGLVTVGTFGIQAAHGADTTSVAKPAVASAQDAAPAKSHKGRPCDDVKAAIASKLDAKGVKNYTLDIAAKDAVGEGKVVGSCEGGSKRILYTRK